LRDAFDQRFELWHELLARLIENRKAAFRHHLELERQMDKICDLGS